QEQVDGLLTAAAAGQLDFPQPADAAEARTWLAEMATAAHRSDGLSRTEEALLRRAGESLGLVTADLDLLLNRARSEAFASARDARRPPRRERAAAQEEPRAGNSSPS